MLHMVGGSGFETFEQHNDEIQGNCVWACSSLAHECSELFDAVADVRQKAATA
jgi:hypothetical protein